jgi:hypothetical protein
MQSASDATPSAMIPHPSEAVRSAVRGLTAAVVAEATRAWRDASHDLLAGTCGGGVPPKVSAAVRKLEQYSYFVCRRSGGGAVTYHHSVLSWLCAATGRAPTDALSRALWRLLTGDDGTEVAAAATAPVRAPKRRAHEMSDGDGAAAVPVSPPPPPAACRAKADENARRAEAHRRIEGELQCPVCLQTIDVPCMPACADVVCLACACRLVRPVLSEDNARVEHWDYVCPLCRCRQRAPTADETFLDMRRRARVLDPVCRNLAAGRCPI